MKKLIAVVTIAAFALVLLPAAASAQIYVKNGGFLGIGAHFETNDVLQPLHLAQPGLATFLFESTTLNSKYSFKINGNGHFIISDVDTPNAELVLLPSGSSRVLLIRGPIEATSFDITSSRTVKEGFEAMDPASVLDKVAELPISRWRYKEDPRATPHIGPMAEDFYAAFASGPGDANISLTDANGVALAAIQGLHQRAQAKDQLIADLLSRIEKLEQRLANQ